MKKQWLILISPVVFILLSINVTFAQKNVFDGSEIEPLYQETGGNRDSLPEERLNRFNQKTTSRYRHALGFAVGGGNYGPTYKLKLPHGFSAQLTLMGWKFSRSYDIDTTIPPAFVRHYLTYNSQTRFMSTLLLEKTLQRLKYGELCAFGSIGGYYNKSHYKEYEVHFKRDTTTTDEYDNIHYYDYVSSHTQKTLLHVNLGVGASVFLLQTLFEAKGNIGVSWGPDKQDFYIGLGFRLAAFFRFGKLDNKQDD